MMINEIEKEPKKMLRLWVIVLCIAVVLLLGIVAALYLEHKLAKPPIYKTTNPITYVKQSLGPTVEVTKPGRTALLPGAKWVPQTFNNCGPATTSMILQYFGYTVNQEQTKAKLRTNPDDKNVFTYEIQNYIRQEYAVESKLLFNGDIARLKVLLANGFYVMLEDWLHPNEDIGHVTILRGYDDDQGVFIADDSYIGVNITYDYETLENTQWKPFNREYLPLYKKEQEPLVKKIIAEDWDERTMYEKAVKKAEQEIAVNDKDMYAFFNLGTSYYGLKNYQKAAEAFEQSRQLGWPRRMLWYQIQPIQTLIELGKYNQVIELANQGLWANDSFAELHLEKARAYKGLGEIDKARNEANTAVSYAPSFQKARDFLDTIKE